MAVHRIDDNAEKILRELAERDGKKPSEWLSALIRDYAAGLEFPGASASLQDSIKETAK